MNRDDEVTCWDGSVRTCSEHHRCRRAGGRWSAWPVRNTSNILYKITSVDLSPVHFPIWLARRNSQDVPAILLRGGICGETVRGAATGWFRRVSRCAGGRQRLQSQAVGPEQSSAAFASEKKHVVVGMTRMRYANPFDADLKWASSWISPTTWPHGIMNTSAAHVGKSRLVGLQSVDGGRPDDGSAIVIHGKLASRRPAVLVSAHC